MNIKMTTLLACLILAGVSSAAIASETPTQPVSPMSVDADTRITSKEQGLEMLLAALERLDGDVPVAGDVVIAFNDKEGKGGEVKEFSGQVSFKIRDDLEGLTTVYDKRTADKIDQESALVIEDEDADTPTIDAIREFNLTSVNNLLSPIPSIKRLLKGSKIEKLVTVTDSGDTKLYQLHFDVPVNGFVSSKEVRGYVDEFDGAMTITIDSKGVPQQISTNYSGSGRAYVIFTMKAAGTSLRKFEVLGNRLVMTANEQFNNYDSTFGKGENSNLHLFTPQILALPNQDYFSNTSKDTSI